MDSNTSEQPSVTAPEQQPVTPQTPNGTTDGDNGNSKKRLALIIGIAAAVVVILVIAIIAIIAMNTVSKKDYAAAATQFDNVSSANSDLGSSLSTVTSDADSATDTVFNNDIDAARADLSKLKDENTKLGALKAVKVGDGKKQYDSFNSQLSKFMTSADNILTSLKNARPALKDCEAVQEADTTADQATATQACADALGKVGSIPDSDVQRFISSAKTNYDSLAKVLKQIAAIQDPYGDDYDTYSSLRDQANKIEDELSNAASDFSSNLEKHQNAVDPSDTANALGDYLEKQAK